MTYACAWCGAISEVDLVALALWGLSSSICPPCCARVFGKDLAEKLLKRAEEEAPAVYVIPPQVGTEVGTFLIASRNQPGECL